MKKLLIKFFGIVFAVAFVLICVNVNFVAILDLPDSVHLTLNELNELNNKSTFGSFTTAELSENIFTVGGERKRNTSLLVKLFGVVPIKKVDAVIEDEKEVFLGGIPLGFSINTEGLIIVDENINTKNDSKSPFKSV